MHYDTLVHYRKHSNSIIIIAIYLQLDHSLPKGLYIFFLEAATVEAALRVL